jgi:hypothetical protein
MTYLLVLHVPITITHKTVRSYRQTGCRAGGADLRDDHPDRLAGNEESVYAIGVARRGGQINKNEPTYKL